MIGVPSTRVPYLDTIDLLARHNSPKDDIARLTPWTLGRCTSPVAVVIDGLLYGYATFIRGLTGQDDLAFKFANHLEHCSGTDTENGILRAQFEDRNLDRWPPKRHPTLHKIPLAGTMDKNEGDTEFVLDLRCSEQTNTVLSTTSNVSAMKVILVAAPLTFQVLPLRGDIKEIRIAAPACLVR